MLFTHFSRTYAYHYAVAEVINIGSSQNYGVATSHVTLCHLSYLMLYIGFTIPPGFSFAPIAAWSLVAHVITPPARQWLAGYRRHRCFHRLLAIAIVVTVCLFCRHNAW